MSNSDEVDGRPLIPRYQGKDSWIKILGEKNPWGRGGEEGRMLVKKESS